MLSPIILFALLWTAPLDHAAHGSAADLSALADKDSKGALVLDVADAEGNPVAGYSVAVDLLAKDTSPTRLRTVADGDTLQRDRIDGLPPGSYRVTVTSGEMSAVVSVQGLRAREQREVIVTLVRSPVVVGRALYSDGTPVAGALVQLVTPAKQRDSIRSFVVTPGISTSAPLQARYEVRRARTDAAGEFRLRADEAVPHLVLVGGDSGDLNESGLLELGSGEDAARDGERLVVTVPLPTEFRGRIEFPAGVDASEFVVYASRGGAPSGMSRYRRPLTTRIASGGGYVFPVVAPGEYLLYVSRWKEGQKVNEVPSGAKLIDQVWLSEGANDERSSTYTGGALMPVTFVVSGLPPGHPATALVLATERGKTVFKRRAPLGVLVVEPGTYELWLAGDGWIARGGLEELLSSDSEAEIAIEVAVTKRRVRLTDGANPLAGVRVFMTGIPREMRMPLETDKDGWIELSLGAGTYSLVPANKDRSRRPRPATITWPLPPEQEEVKFEYR